MTQGKLPEFEDMLSEAEKRIDRLEKLSRLHTISISGDKIYQVTVRITEVEYKKMHNIKWHSDPFYTHERGYRMCLHVIISGAGDNPGNHISVFLYLMKEQYDNTLKWPLVGIFQIELLNQKMDEENYTITIQ